MTRNSLSLHVALSMTLAASLWGCTADTTADSAAANRHTGRYVAGGRNVEAADYAHSDGMPPFPDRAAYLGTLSGDWRTIGRELGARAAESVRVVSDLWWKQMCDDYGREATLAAFDLYEAQIAALDPGLVELMHGIADGAADALSLSPYADELHPLHAGNYQRVLAVNLYDEWAMMHPRRFPDGTSTYAGTVDGPHPPPHMVGCSAFAARGKATANGEVIVAHNRHSPFDPRCYQQVWVMHPDGGCSCWVLSNLPQVSGNQVVNEHGVSLVLTAGGMTNPRSLGHPAGPFEAEAFGVPWFHLFVWVGTHATSADEAIDMLTRGTEAYRDRAGRESLLRAGGWNFLVADRTTLAVVEVSADRYAVRQAGDELGFTAGWDDPDYIVATNHFLCEHSYDAENNRTTVPMTVFNEGYWRHGETGAVTRLTESGVRFFTLMWDIRQHLGRVDRYRAQQIMSGTYARDDETGELVEVAQDRDGTWQLWGRVNSCTAGYAATWGGTCDAKIAVFEPDSVSVAWTLGSPIHWQGAWDRFIFG